MKNQNYHILIFIKHIKNVLIIYLVTYPIELRNLIPKWVLDTLEEHEIDKRDKLY